MNDLRGGEVVGNHGFWGATPSTCEPVVDRIAGGEDRQYRQHLKVLTVAWTSLDDGMICRELSITDPKTALLSVLSVWS
jgi:hypothetical protein